MNAQGFAAVLANMVITTLAVWIPLLPLFFLLRRVMEDRAGAATCELFGIYVCSGASRGMWAAADGVAASCP
jgi:hypothetical protein